MRLRLPAAAAAAILVLAGSAAVLAQIEGGGRGVAAIDSSNDFEVTGISVDVAAKTADAARLGGWRIAQREGWRRLSQRLGAGGGGLPDGVLDSLVTGIVIENEQIGPTRYVAKLGVLFDRARAGAILGVATTGFRSPPMVVVPVEWSGGVGQVFEARTAWQEAWARYRTGNSVIDYIRPTGNGADGLLLNAGQTLRPGRGWWRTILDQYGGSDVLIPMVRLWRQWPGGPVIAAFEARHGPDNRSLGGFTLRVGTPAGVPELLDEGVRRIDELYQRALRDGVLRTDPSLSYPVTAGAADPMALPEDSLAADTASVPVIALTVQFDTPGAGAVTAGEAAMRAIPGVTAATTTSLALGGVSQMAVTFAGSIEDLRAALEARGWQVLGSGNAIRIRRAPQLLPPDVGNDSSVAG